MSVEMVAPELPATLVEVLTGDVIPLRAVSLVGALNYLAFGRFEGTGGVRAWCNFPLADEDSVAQERAALGVAARGLQRAIRLGNVDVHEARDDDVVPSLWRIDAGVWAEGAFIYGYGNCDYVQGRDDAIVRRPLFSAVQIAAQGDPDFEDDEWLDGSAPTLLLPVEQGQGDKPEGKGKRRGRRIKLPHGEALGGFLARMAQIGMTTAAAYSQEALGAFLIEEYERLESNPPHPDTAAVMASGAVAEWQRRNSGEE